MANKVVIHIAKHQVRKVKGGEKIIYKVIAIKNDNLALNSITIGGITIELNSYIIVYRPLKDDSIIYITILLNSLIVLHIIHMYRRRPGGGGAGIPVGFHQNNIDEARIASFNNLLSHKNNFTFFNLYRLNKINFVIYLLFIICFVIILCYLIIYVDIDIVALLDIKKY